LEEDALHILDWLQQNNFRVGLISNASDTEDVYFLLNQFKIEKYFEEVIISAQFGWRKPYGKIFDHAAKLLDIDPGNCLMVGDRLDMDIHGAKMAGFQAVWITRRSIHKDKLHQFETKPDFQISNFEELIQILQSSK
jgi:FMN phosphatase YigB (HAD superfamily)